MDDEILEHPRRSGIGIKAALVAAGLAAGVIGATALGASATTTGSGTATAYSSTAPSAQSTTAPADADGDGPHGAGGPGGAGRPDEKSVSTADAATLKAAALKAVPGGTVDRVEADSGDATYEAHMTKSDGSRVTVKFDAKFAVTAVENGMGK